MPYEIDFFPVGTKSSSGDAISLRYGSNQSGYTIHIVDGGYSDTAPGIIDHIRNGYGSTKVSHVVLTHADGDHAAGLMQIMETLEVGILWMNRPWLYAEEIIHHFHGNWTVHGLIRHLRDQYPTLVELENLAIQKNVPIYEAFQGTQIGQFTILAPSRDRYLSLLPDFDKTPERKTTIDNAVPLLKAIIEAAQTVIRWVNESWFRETLPASPPPTSASNESSLVQMAVIEGDRLVLTGDVGPEGLKEAVNYAEYLYGHVPPQFFQIPHHGSRRNVTPSALDQWLGTSKLPGSNPIGTAFCSAAELDQDHPRKKVVNAFVRRGYEVHITNGRHIFYQRGMARTGGPLTPEPFSTQVEE